MGNEAGTNNFFSVECQDGVLRSCSIKGKKIKTDIDFYNPLAPGDTVEIEEDSLSEDKGQITALGERKNLFLRWNVKGQKPQILAANLDYLILVTTPEEPPFRPRFIDRCLIQAEEQKITPIILINKFDLPGASDPDFVSRVQNWEDLELGGLGLRRPKGFGQDWRRPYGLGGAFARKAKRLCWPVGRGKVQPDKPPEQRRDSKDWKPFKKIRTRRAHDHKGREFKPLLGKCKFGASCTHTSEPGCKILEAVYSGAISEDRYESYKNITEELKTGDWRD